MKLVFLAISVFFLISESCAQDINFGFNFGTNPYNRFIFKGDSYKPENSFYTYIPEKAGSGYIFDEHKFFNTVTFGLSARISRKKIGLNIEPQILLEYIRFNFKAPYSNKRVMSRRGYRVPIYLTYHLFNNPLSPHINAGIIIGEEVNYEYQFPDFGYFLFNNPPYEEAINYGDRHLNNVFYDNQKLKMHFLLGIGKRIKKLDYNLRYVADFNTYETLKGTRWQIEFSVNFYFLSKAEFSTKNYLYEE